MAAPAEERQAWLRRAETEDWSVAELRAALAQGKRLKVARQAELAKDGEKDGHQSEPTPFDQAPSLSPQTPPDRKVDAAPLVASTDPAPPPDLHGLHCAAVLDTIRGTIRGLTDQVAAIPANQLLEVRSELDEVVKTAGELRAVITQAIESATVREKEPPPASRGVREGNYGLA